MFTVIDNLDTIITKTTKPVEVLVHLPRDLSQAELNSIQSSLKQNVSLTSNIALGSTPDWTDALRICLQPGKISDALATALKTVDIKARATKINTIGSKFVLL